MPQKERAKDTTTIGIAGMTCDNCARRVERALRGLVGVEDVVVDRASGSARVTFDRSQVDVAAMHAAVLKSGCQSSAWPSA